MGDNEKWLSSTSGQWYCLLTDGELRRWAGSWSATLQPAALIATLGPSVYAKPGLLLNAQVAAAPATVSVRGGVLTVNPAASFRGTFSVQVTVSDGVNSASTSFNVTVASGSAPTLGTIANQTARAGSTFTIALNGNDSAGLALTYSATVLATSSLAYQLKTSLGLTYAGTYYKNLMGDNEKWLTGSGGQWYCLLPDGELRRWAGNWTSTLQAAALVANLGAAYYTTPNLLWNATIGVSAATVSIHNGQLVVKTSAAFRGSLVVQVAVSSGSHRTTETFTVTVTA
jgi:hypothetical protein